MLTELANSLAAGAVFSAQILAIVIIVPALVVGTCEAFLAVARLDKALVNAFGR